jgi:hypothetical protein
MSERDPVLDALDELAAALEDAWRRYVAGDDRALESVMLRAAYAQALELLPAYRQARRFEFGPIVVHGGEA